jgi:hypothetical protein
MSHPTHALVFAGALQMCGGGTTASTDDPSTGLFSCADYQLMMDVEVDLGRACSVDQDCSQVAFVSLGSCPSDSVVFNGSFDLAYAAELYDEATEAGCTVVLPTGDDCSATEVACTDGACSWR